MKRISKLLHLALLGVLLLSACASPRGPLHYAALNGESTRVKLLIYGGEGINERNRKGDAPLHLAAFNGQTEVVQVLLDHGAEVDVLHQFNAMTPLHKAAAWGHRETVKILLHGGSNINARDVQGETALYKASMNGHWDVVKLLLDNGGRL